MTTLREIPDRAPRMTDVAALAGVSHQTVSRVVNGASRISPATRARVLEAIDRLGYRRNFAARTLAFRRAAVAPTSNAGESGEVTALAEKLIRVALEEWRASGGTADLEAVFLACANAVRR